MTTDVPSFPTNEQSTTDVPSFPTNEQSHEEKRTTGCPACLPDLQTTRLKNVPSKEKVIVVIVSMQKKQTNVQIVYILEGNYAFLTLDRFVFSCPFYRSRGTGR